MARIERLTVYPVKALDGIERDRSAITSGGSLAHDREFALFDGEDPFNGKRTARVHELETDFDFGESVLTVARPDGERKQFDLTSECERAAAWFGDYFDEHLELRRDTDAGYVDRQSLGPSVVSTATLREVASWFDDLGVDGVRRRLRANVEIGGVPAFWEDRFLGTGAPDFVAGDVRFEGAKPCGRCVVPERDPDTGEATPGFREQFVQRRRETLPDWVDRDAFEQYYAVMVITRLPEESRDATLHVGEDVRIVENESPA